MAGLENEAGVDFEPRIAEPNWIYVQPSSVNSSYVGMQSSGPQMVNISDWAYKAVIQHELLHALGFRHTQQRSDRDRYIIVHTNNIQPSELHNYNIATQAEAWGVYDFDSIMHYEEFVASHAINTGAPVLSVRPPYNTTWARRLGIPEPTDVMSPGDINSLRAAYGYPFSRSIDDTRNITAVANDRSAYPSISGDGRFVAFYSKASNLVANDTNNRIDVFVYDTRQLTYALCSVNSQGQQANDHSQQRPVISSDGRFVAFTSLASNLVSGIAGNNVFLRDRANGTTTLISQSTGGQPHNGTGALVTSMSADGRYVVFQSAASNLVSGDTNGVEDVFVRDVSAGTTVRVSAAASGQEGNGASGYGRLSVNGDFVVFHSEASNLVGGDTNGARDVFLRNMRSGAVTCVSLGGNASSDSASVAADGTVVFASAASNLVAGDNNGVWDTFLRPVGGGVVRVSVSRNGAELNGASGTGGGESISRDGRYVLFVSQATNVGYSGAAGTRQLYIRDMVTQMTCIASLRNTGPTSSHYPNGECANGVISEDGRFVTYHSDSTNIVQPDVNGQRDVFVRDCASRPEDYEATGPGCQGTTYKPELFLAGWPYAGNDGFGYTYFNAAPGSVFVLVWGLAEGSSYLGPCHVGVLLSGPVLGMSGMSSAVGQGRFELPLPRGTSAIGVSIYAQGFSMDPGGPFLGLSFTGTQRVTIQN